MKHLCYCIIILLMVLISCKQKPDSTLNSALMNVGDLQGNADSTGIKSSGWSKEFLTKNLKDCISKAGNSMAATDAYVYCDCMMDKIQKKYPDENDAETKFTKEELAVIRRACLPAAVNKTGEKSKSGSSAAVTWSAADQKQFMDNCRPGVVKVLGTGGANNYCDCIMKKLMQEYPDSREVDNVSEAHVKQLASDCLGR